MAKKRSKVPATPNVRVDRTPPWAIIYYRRANGSVPALEFLDGCPLSVQADLAAVLDAVAAAPPPQFSGGGKWEAMRGGGGYYEVRVTGPDREQFRLFCLLENGSDEELIKRGLAKPAIAVLTGMRKPWRTVFKDSDYDKVRALGEEHREQHPRRIAT
jgi:hypothetical protein